MVFGLVDDRQNCGTACGLYIGCSSKWVCCFISVFLFLYGL